MKKVRLLGHVVSTGEVKDAAIGLACVWCVIILGVVALKIFA